MKLCPSERHTQPAMPGSALRDSSPPHTAAAALYGWVILQIGDSIARYAEADQGRPILCSGKPAMTLAREDSSGKKVDVLYIPWPITPEDLVKRLADEMRWHLDSEQDLAERIRGQF